MLQRFEAIVPDKPGILSGRGSLAVSALAAALLVAGCKSTPPQNAAVATPHPQAAQYPARPTVAAACVQGLPSRRQYASRW